MPEGTNNSIINLGDVSKPADTLIKKISKAVGGVFAPYQIKRIAKAQAEAAIIEAQTEIQITDLQRRAMHRFIDEEARYQKNIEDITSQALPQLTEGAKPEAVEDDWVTNFFDKSRIVSDAEMQALWSRVLAGEANAPRTFSRRTVNLLSDIDKTDAECFSRLCGFAWMVGDLKPLVFDPNGEIYQKNGIDFTILIHLESIGLIQFSGISNFTRVGLPKTMSVFYYGRPLVLQLPKDSDNNLGTGKTLLTKAGKELAAICGSKPVEGFWEYVAEKWAEYLPKTEPSPIPSPPTPP
jgi:hypothetical protein